MTGWLIFGGIVLFLAVLLSLSITAVIEYDKDFRIKIKYLFFTIYKIPQTPKKNKKKEREKEEKEAASGLEKAADAVEKTEKAAETLSPNGESQSGTPPDDSGNNDIKDGADSSEDSEKPDEPLTKSEQRAKEKECRKAEKARKKAQSRAKLDDLKEKLPLLKTAIESAKGPLKKLIRKIRVYDVTVYMLCTGEDAAEAALNYGKANAVINGICGWLSGVMTLKVSEINISVDFQKNEPVTEVYCKVKLRVFTALACGLSFFFNIVKNSVKKQNEEINGGQKNGRTSDSGADEHRNAENSRAC